MKSKLDHIALRTAHYEEMKAFFEKVFFMHCDREIGERPNRKLWFQEGIQLCEQPEEFVGENGYDHFCLLVNDIAEVMRILENDYPECRILDSNWFLRPNQTKVELKSF